MDNVVRAWEAMAPLRAAADVTAADVAGLAARFAADHAAAMAAGASLEVARLATRDADGAGRLARALGPANARALLRAMREQNVEPAVIILVLRDPPSRAAPPTAAFQFNVDVALARGEESLAALVMDTETALYEAVGRSAGAELLTGALSCARSLVRTVDGDG